MFVSFDEKENMCEIIIQYLYLNIIFNCKRRILRGLRKNESMEKK